MTKLHELNKIGQSVWLDFINRDLITSGDLQDLVNDGLRGMTSNPKIFREAIAEGSAYDKQLQDLSSQNLTPVETYEALAIQDIQSAADILRPVYDETDGVDGYVSLEANPQLAYETNKTIKEVLRLNQAVNRPNVMFKVPATNHGIVAVRRLIGQGININITLMFSLTHYNAVAQAYIEGLETLHQNGGDLSQVASVASFFISRIDVMLDDMLKDKGKPELKGKIGIANAKLVYQRFREIFSGDRWQKLASSGARVQRPLWASTSTKDPDYIDTLYIDNLIGPDTVNTMPPNTMSAFLHHGNVQQTIDKDIEEAKQHMAQLTDLGINMLEVGETLQNEGVDKFNKPFDALLATITKQAQIQ